MAREVKLDFNAVQLIFENEIIEQHLITQAHPSVLFITGVSGSGKSTLIKELNINALKIQPDNYRKLHPKINVFIENLGRNEAHKKTGNYAFRFAQALMLKAIEQKFNVIYEATFSKLETALSLIQPFQEKGYQIFVVQLPINVEQSIARNLARYEEKKSQDHTIPRMATKEDIEKMANNYLNVIQQIKENGITILNRNELAQFK